MIEIVFKVIDDNDDEIKGNDGFFKINCNGNSYGEVYPTELEDVMDKVSVYDWFERLLRVAGALQKYNYVVLSDTESNNRWIEFIGDTNNIVTISIIKSNKVSGTQDIEYTDFEDKEYVEWWNQKVSYISLCKEIIDKAHEYIEILLKENNNSISEKIEHICRLLRELENSIE